MKLAQDRIQGRVLMLNLLKTFGCVTRSSVLFVYLHTRSISQSYAIYEVSMEQYVYFRQLAVR
jgi:hypothetical protein